MPPDLDADLGALSSGWSRLARSELVARGSQLRALTASWPTTRWESADGLLAAHLIADTCDEPRFALDWDLRSLRIAITITTGAPDDLAYQSLSSILLSTAESYHRMNLHDPAVGTLQCACMYLAAVPSSAYRNKLVNAIRRLGGALEVGATIEALVLDWMALEEGVRQGTVRTDLARRIPIEEWCTSS